MHQTKRGAAAQRKKLLQTLNQLCSPSQSTSNPLFLLDALYEIDLEVVEEDLLQVAHVCITHTNAETQGALHQYMLYIAARSLQIALRLSWIVDAVSPFYLTTGLSNRIKDVHDSIENFAVNQVSSKHSRAREMHLFQEPEEADLQDVRRKELRVRIFNDQRSFVTRLTDISEDLRKFPDRAQRKVELRKRMKQLNDALADLWVMHPLCRSSDPVMWIVGVAVEDCVVFSSRERAPYVIRYDVLIDRTTTMQDPSMTSLRADNGDFMVAPDSAERYVPGVPAPKKETKNTSAVSEDEALRFSAFGEGSTVLKAKRKQRSPWGAHPNWDIRAVIVKAGDDIRQEELALQLIGIVNRIWKEKGITSCSTPYAAIATHSDCGLIEFIDDSSSIDAIKKSTSCTQLSHFFVKAFGGRGSTSFLTAQRNFVESMAGYSVIAYLLQIKDRHNGNLMITIRGELLHIDFGFFMTTSPGGWNFESAPFKLSQELIDVMGGVNSDAFNYYKTLVFLGFESLREHAADIVSLTALMAACNSMACFGSDPIVAISQMKGRFGVDVASETDFSVHVKNLIMTSADNWRTRRYDQFQTLQNGIL